MGKIAKEFSTLNMVYPQVKAMLYFDKTINGNDYRLSGSSKTTVTNAISANPALRANASDRTATWIPAGKFFEETNGSVLLGAAGRTIKSNDMRATYYLDGAVIASPTAAPNYCKIDLDKVIYGKHKLDVTLSDNNGFTVTKTYTLDYSSDTSVLISEGWKTDYAKPVVQTITFNGAKVSFNTMYIEDAYGGGTNYVLLRDIADLVDGTAAQFNVGWDDKARLISVDTGSAYTTRNGTEGQALFTTNQTYKLLESKVIVDGVPTKLQGVTFFDSIGAYNYFKLRDLGDICGFVVDWKPNVGIIVDAAPLK